MLTNPTLVCEVISPSSASNDRGFKSQMYRSLPSLKYYLLIEQDRVFVQLFTVQDDGWLLNEFDQLEDVIPLEMIDVKLPLSEVYRGIEFD